MVRQFSAGGVVFRKKDNQILWLLIQPAGGPARKSLRFALAGGDEFHKQIRWQLPKGLVGEDEKMEETAVREVAEEGGVKAKIIAKIDTIKIFFRNTFEGKPEEKVLKTITFYLMEYLGEKTDGHDEEVAEIAWLAFEEAKEKLTFKSEKEILEKAKEMLPIFDSQLKIF